MPAMRPRSWTAPRTERPSTVIAYHCYGFSGAALRQALEAVTTFHEAYPGMSIHETECTQDRNQFWPKAVDILIDHTRYWANSVADWNVALDPAAARTRPSARPCGPASARPRAPAASCRRPSVISGPAGKATARFTREYYELGHFTKYVRPGAVRLGSARSGRPATPSTTPSTTWPSGTSTARRCSSSTTAGARRRASR